MKQQPSSSEPGWLRMCLPSSVSPARNSRSASSNYFPGNLNKTCYPFIPQLKRLRANALTEVSGDASSTVMSMLFGSVLPVF